MKRSRTCHCLVELDDTPKRTRSSPNLDSLRRCLIKALQHQQQQQQQQQQSKHERSVFANQGKQNFDLASAFRLLQRSPTPGKNENARWLVHRGSSRRLCEALARPLQAKRSSTYSTSIYLCTVMSPFHARHRIMKLKHRLRLSVCRPIKQPVWGQMPRAKACPAGTS